MCMRRARLAAHSARAPSLHDGDVPGARAAGEAEPAADALELENRKDAAGERLMHQMSSRGRAQGRRSGRHYWFDDADRLQRLL